MRVVTVNGTSVALGLSWHYLPGLDPTQPIAEARQAAKRLKVGSGVLHKQGTRTLLGVGSGKASKKTLSGAVIASALPEPTILVAMLDTSSYWVCLAGGGKLDEQHDSVVDAERAYAIIREIQGRQSGRGAHDFPVRVLGRSELTSPYLQDAPVTDWAAFLANAPAAAQFVRLGGPTVREVVVVSVAILLGITFFAWDQYDKRKKEQEALAALQAQSAAEAEAFRADQEAARERAIELAIAEALAQDTATKAPDAVIKHCFELHRALGRFIGGYGLSETTCTNTGVSLAVGQKHPQAPTFGFPDRLREAAFGLGATVSFATDMRAATLALPGLEGPQRPAITSIADLPSLAELQSVLGGPVLSWKRGDVAARYTITDPEPRVIHFTDPTTLDEEGRPKLMQVPPERSYLRATVKLESPMPGRLPVDAFAVPAARLEQLRLIPTGLEDHTLVSLDLVLRQ